MGAHYFCSKTKQFLLCDPELIGKKTTCSECGREHDVIPADNDTAGQAAVPGADNHDMGVTANTPKKISKGCVIAAVVLFLVGLSQFSDGLTQYELSSLFLAWVIAVVFFIRSFFPPVRWWQGILTFFGGSFIGVGLRMVLFERQPILVLVMGVIIGALLLFFAFREFGKSRE